MSTVGGASVGRVQSWQSTENANGARAEPTGRFAGMNFRPNLGRYLPKMPNMSLFGKIFGKNASLPQNLRVGPIITVVHHGLNEPGRNDQPTAAVTPEAGMSEGNAGDNGAAFLLLDTFMAGELFGLNAETYNAMLGAPELLQTALENDVFFTFDPDYSSDPAYSIFNDRTAIVLNQEYKRAGEGTVTEMNRQLSDLVNERDDAALAQFGDVAELRKGREYEFGEVETIGSNDAEDSWGLVTDADEDADAQPGFAAERGETASSQFGDVAELRKGRKYEFGEVESTRSSSSDTSWGLVVDPDEDVEV